MTGSTAHQRKLIRINKLLSGGGPETVVTIDEIAAAWGVSTRSVRRWTDERGLPYRRVDHVRYVTRAALAQWLSGQQLNGEG